MPKAKSKKNKEEIIELCMAHLAVNGFDQSIKDLCKATKIKKSQFRSEFGSIKKFEEFVWHELMHAAISTASEDPQFSGFSKRDKLLSLYYTFFENCGLNNAFLKQSVKHHGRAGMINVLKPLKKEFLIFISSIHRLSLPIGKQYEESISKIAKIGVGEAFYGQFLFLLDFWAQDTSNGYEKTDIAIEKTVKASMDILDVTPIKSMIDFAKFVWQERLSNTL